MTISLSPRTRRYLAPTGFTHTAMPTLIANARQQATWFRQSMHNHQVGLWYEKWVNKNFAVYLPHRNHSMNCTVFAVLHLPALRPFPGPVSLPDAIQTIGARVVALQAHHPYVLHRANALGDMIHRTFVRVPLDIVRHSVLSLH